MKSVVATLFLSFGLTFVWADAPKSVEQIKAHAKEVLQVSKAKNEAKASQSKKQEKAASAKLETPVVVVADNANGKITPKSIEEVFAKAGFFINDNRNMLPPFKKNFGKTHHDVYTLFTVFKKPYVLKLAKKHPSIGLFTPLSMSIWSPKGSKKIYVSRLSVNTIAKIMGIDAGDPDLVSYINEVDAAIKQALPGASHVDLGYEPTKPEGELVYAISIKMDEGADAEEFKDDLQMKFEGALPKAEFILAGFNDLNYDFDEADYDGYSFYDVYSICNLEVIYTVSQKYPEAGAFAPCSLYMYNKADTDTVEMGFPTVYNWFATMHMNDEASKKVLLKAQKRMEDILEKLAGKKEKAQKAPVKDEKSKKCAAGKCGAGKCSNGKK